jgi:hypothetical protein
MKNIPIILFAFILTLTFTASDIAVSNGNRSGGAQKCPYLQSLRQDQPQLKCPYLNDTQEGNSDCPYLQENGESQTGCPYLDGLMQGECPYLKEKGQEVLKAIKYLPLPEGKNT